MKSLQTLALALLFCPAFIYSQNNIRMASYYDSKDSKSYYIAWDIKTGRSMQYAWNGSSHAYEPFAINIPAQPVSGATGNIMFDVHYNFKDSKSYYIAWDTKTGKSVQYSWNGSEHKYEAFAVNLPDKPLTGVTGEVMIRSYYDSTDNKSYYLVYDTNGGHSMQYYWNGTDYKWNAFEINLPEKPLNSN